VSLVLVLHKERRFKCSMCSLTSPYKSTIEKHVAAVHDGIRFFCKHCNKLFKQHYYFRDYMKTHEPGCVDTSYKCDFCPKSFKTRHILKKHVKMHNAERDCFRLRCVRKEVYGMRIFQKAHESAHWGEAVRVRFLRQGIHADEVPQDSRAGAY
jgi:hypothetical protein